MCALQVHYYTHVSFNVSVLAASSSGCAVNNGGCEIFCFSVPNSDGDGTRVKCDCPTGIILDSDNNQTCDLCKYIVHVCYPLTGVLHVCVLLEVTSTVVIQCSAHTGREWSAQPPLSLLLPPLM